MKISVRLKDCILVAKWARVVVSVNRFLSMPGLKGLKMAIIGFVNN